MKRTWMVCLFTWILAQPTFLQEVIPPESPEPHTHIWVQTAIGAHTGNIFQGYAAWGEKSTDPSLAFAFGIPLGIKHEGSFVYATSEASLKIEKTNGEIFQVDAVRKLFGLRWNYKIHRSDQFELLIGAGLGISRIRRKTNTGSYQYTLPPKPLLPAYNADIKRETTRLSLLLVPISFRFYPLKFLAIGGEWAIGAPYYAGAFIRLGIPIENQ